MTLLIFPIPSTLSVTLGKQDISMHFLRERFTFSKTTIGTTFSSSSVIHWNCPPMNYLNASRVAILYKWKILKWIDFFLHITGRSVLCYMKLNQIGPRFVRCPLRHFRCTLSFALYINDNRNDLFIIRFVGWALGERTVERGPKFCSGLLGGSEIKNLWSPSLHPSPRPKRKHT